jgi:hypothetical protein
MDATREPTHELRLRGLIAFASRCTRRVFPVIILADAAVRECDEAIAMAEAFAAGEPGALIQAARVAEAVKGDTSPPGGGYPRSPQQNIWHARQATVALAHAAVSAFDTSLHVPPSKIYCEEAVGHAVTAIRDARLTTEPFGDAILPGDPRYDEWARQYAESARQAEWARQARKRDLDALRHSHHGLSTELGLAIDTSSRGPLGPLWLPGQTPSWYTEGLHKWYKPRGVTVVTADEFLRSDNPKSIPDLVCWYRKSATDAADFETLKESLRRVQEVSRALGQHPPGLVVYAPGIAGEQWADLVDLGANVYVNPPDQWFEPRDDHSLRDMLHDRLEEAYQGWEQEEGLWSYSDARISSRVGPTPPVEPFVAQESTGETAEQTRDEDKATRDDYQKLLQYLRTDQWWQTEY